MLVPRPLNYRLSNAVSMGGRRRNRGAPVSGADGVHEASETQSNSFAQRHYAVDAGKRCVAESSVGAGAAAAELPRERCCIDARCAQKWWRICFGGRWGV